jgi:hypothetical protein
MGTAQRRQALAKSSPGENVICVTPVPSAFMVKTA